MPGRARIRLARTQSDYEACVGLQREVWGLSDLEITPRIQLIATVHAGGVLLVAEGDGGRIDGFAYAFPALRGGEPHLHSDMLAVRAEARGHGLGLRLKWAQRTEALRRRVSLITWTFDPLQAANARLNLHHLGARASEFLPDLYGSTGSPLHHGLPTDRLLVRWELGRPDIARRAASAAPPPPPPSSAPRINQLVWRAGRFTTTSPRLDLDAPTVLLEIPADWEGLCRSALADAAAFQGQVRATFEAYFARGYVAEDFVSTPCAMYVLRRPLRRATRLPSPPRASGRRSTRSRSPRKGRRGARRGGARGGRGRR